jgi:hypothetical protein
LAGADDQAQRQAPSIDHGVDLRVIRPSMDIDIAMKKPAASAAHVALPMIAAAGSMAVLLRGGGRGRPGRSRRPARRP